MRHLDLSLKGRVLVSALLAAWVAVLAAVWGVTRHPPIDEAMTRVQALGVIRVGTDASYPPFESLSSSQEMQGFDIDLARDLGHRLGVQVEFVNIAYDGLFDALLAERVDVLISALADLPQSASKASFTLPYFNAGDTLVVRHGGPVRSLQGLDGRRLAVEFGSSADMEARLWQRRLAGLTVSRYDDPDAALAAVLNGQADAALVDGITARVGIGQHPELAWAGNADDTLFAVATRSDSTDLRAKLNDGIKAQFADGTIGRLMERWFGPQRGVDDP